MHLMPSHALLTSSIEYGIVARSLPLTGKILSGYLDASGTRAGLGIGNPNAEFTPDVSACAITSDGGTAKIVWGSRVGHVLFTTAPRAMEKSRRSAADVKRCTVVDEHEGAALWLDSPLNWVITGGNDGRVKLWDAKAVSCPWTSEKIVNSFIPDPCVKVFGLTSQGWIVSVTQSGDIHFWSGFDFASSTRADQRIMTLQIDLSHSSPTILVAYQNDPHFYRIRIDTSTGHIETTTFSNPFFGSTFIVVPFFRSDNEAQNQKFIQPQSSFILVSDHLGCISLYAWGTDPASSNLNSRTLPLSADIDAP
jgi:WD40 repeat protein